MTTNYRRKLFRSVMDCGCTLSLGEFDEAAQLEDVEEWLKDTPSLLVSKRHSA